jgi:hypothetical protein
VPRKSTLSRILIERLNAHLVELIEWRERRGKYATDDWAKRVEPPWPGQTR